MKIAQVGPRQIQKPINQLSRPNPKFPETPPKTAKIAATQKVKMKMKIPEINLQYQEYNSWPVCQLWMRTRGILYINKKTQLNPQLTNVSKKEVFYLSQLMEKNQCHFISGWFKTDLLCRIRVKSRRKRRWPETVLKTRMTKSI